MSTLLDYFCKATSANQQLSSSSNVVGSAGGADSPGSADPTCTGAQNSVSTQRHFDAATIDMETKIEVVKLAESSSIPAALAAFPGLRRTTVQRWLMMVRQARSKALQTCLSGAAVMPVCYETALTDRRTMNGRQLPVQALEKAYERFCDAREQGLPITSSMLRQMVLSEIIALSPHIVHTRTNPGGWFKCCDNWLRRWKEANVVKIRRATAARRGDIEDIEEIRQTYLYRVAYIVRQYKLVPELVFHADETGVAIHPTGSSTLDFVGSKTVQVIGLGDKRQATVMLGGDLAGGLLQPQVVFEGKTSRVLPPSVPGVEMTFTANHWASFDTTIQWLGTVLVPHALAVKTRMGLPPDHPCLLVWDVWFQHRSPDTLQHIAQHYPWLKLAFVPASTTGQLQIADVSMNLPFKTHIRQCLSELVLQRFEAGEQYSFPVAELRALFVQWVASAAEHVQRIGAVMNGARRVGLDQCFSEQMGLEALVRHQLGGLWDSRSKNDAVAVGGQPAACISGGEEAAHVDDAPGLSIPEVAMTETGSTAASTTHSFVGEKRRRRHQKSVHCSHCWARGHNRATCPKLAERKRG